MSAEYLEVENRIRKIVEEISGQAKPNIRKIARQYNVPYPRLLHRYKGGHSRCSRPATNRLLSNAEELSVSLYIRHLNELMIPVKPAKVTDFVNSILERRHKDPSTPAPKVGSHWLRRFLDRNTDLFIEDQRTMLLKSSSSRPVKQIQRWLERFNEVVTTNAIEPGDVYSFGETRFQIQEEEERWEITLRPQLNSEGESDSSPNNGERIQVSEAVSGDGSALPPLMILTSNHAQQEWAKGLESHVSLAISDSGCCSADNPSCRWIRHFDHHSSLRQKGEYRLLLIPQYEPHSSQEFLSYCEEKKIILLFFIPFAGPVLHPLARILQSSTEGALRATSQNLTNHECLSSIISIRQSTLTNSAILSGFRDTGLIPYSPDTVLDKIREERPSTPANLSSTPSEEPWVTPKTPQDFKFYEEKLKIIEPGTDFFKEGISKLIKGGVAQCHVFEGLKMELESFKDAHDSDGG